MTLVSPNGGGGKGAPREWGSDTPAYGKWDPKGRCIRFVESEFFACHGLMYISTLRVSAGVKEPMQNVIDWLKKCSLGPKTIIIKLPSFYWTELDEDRILSSLEDMN